MPLLTAAASAELGFGGTVDVLAVARTVALTPNRKELKDRQAPPLPGDVLEEQRASVLEGAEGAR